MTPMDTRASTPMPLRIARSADVAKGARSFAVVPAGGAPLPPFTPGSHVRVQTPSGALRKYSLCNDAAERHRYVIAVKRQPAGQGASVSMHDAAHEGLILPPWPPDNAFALKAGTRDHLFIEGGTGI